MSDLMTRAEWDAYSDEERWTLYSLTEKSEADMKSVLQEITECPDHGFCLPFKRQWIREQQGAPTEKGDWLLDYDRSVRQSLVGRSSVVTVTPELQMYHETRNYRIDRVKALLSRCNLSGIAYQIIQDNTPNRVRFDLATSEYSADELKRRLLPDAEVLELEVWTDKDGWNAGTAHAQFFVRAS